MTKQTTVRLPDALAEEVEAVARVKEVSVNQFIIDSLSIEIDRVSKDAKFMDALKQVVDRDREILDRLAQS